MEIMSSYSIEIFQILLILVVLGVLMGKIHLRTSLPTNRSRRVILDTCALIDGRILELSDAGFVPDELIVPDFVLHELQMLADGADGYKRERARFGLDVVQRLQENPNCSVLIDSTKLNSPLNDDKLVELAHKKGVQLYTTDFNLNKLAEIKGVRVLNVNQLAQSLRPMALPGEQKSIKILQKGSNQNQGIGYLDDGTMVVVEGAAKKIGQLVAVEVTRVHQTIAGKMVFSTLVNSGRQNHVQAQQRRANATIRKEHSIKTR